MTDTQDPERLDGWTKRMLERDAMSPSTEAGRRLLERLEHRCQSLGGCALFGADHTDVARALPAIEAEARAALLAELEAGVEGLRDSEWRECGGACHDNTIAAVLDLIRKAGKP